jgi:hypothetical protein
MPVVVPDLSRLIETYIRIGHPSVHLWAPYLDLLRFQVAPLVTTLRKQGHIGWYSFLVHDRTSGVPTTEGDHDCFIHLCLELVGPATLDHVVAALPRACLFTRVHGQVSPESIYPADASSFCEPQLPKAWALIGATSEWTLDFLASHQSNRPIPIQNVAQFLHYLGNQFMVGATIIPMP